MSNYGFHQAMEEAGIEVATTTVGDRYVLDELERRDWTLGGEQSGPHDLDRLRADRRRDRGRAARRCARSAAATCRTRSRSTKLPQTLVNVEVADREAIAGATAVWEAVERESAALEGRGRVLVRPSGTEPLVRVMVEAPSRPRPTRSASGWSRVVEARADARRPRPRYP